MDVELTGCPRFSQVFLVGVCGGVCVDTIRDIKLEDNEIITAYDVSALFTSIPPEDVLNVVTEAFKNDPK